MMRGLTSANTLKVLAILSLLGALIAGQVMKKASSSDMLAHHFPNSWLEEIKGSDGIYRLISKEINMPWGFVIIRTTQGWGGPGIAAVHVDNEGIIQKAIVLAHKETPSFFQSLEDSRFFEQFFNKKIINSFIIGQDVQAVSGATVSSKAFTKAYRESSHNLARNQFQFTVPEESVQAWEITGRIYILIGMYILVLTGAVFKFSRLRKIILAFNIGFLGFYLSNPINISDIAKLIYGFVPSLRTDLFWWLLIIGALLFVLLYGRNLYCLWICPFGGLQEWITTIGGVRMRISGKVIKLAKKLSYSLLWLSLMIIFLTSTPANGSFEPFGVIFSFKGIKPQWYLTLVVIFGSFLIPRFWCRFFCPVGAFLGNLLKLRKNSVKLIKGNQ